MFAIVFVKNLQKAQQIKLEEWRKRSPIERIFEWGTRLLDQQS